LVTPLSWDARAGHFVNYLADATPRIPRVWDVPELPDTLALASTEFLVLDSSRFTSTVLWALIAQPEFGAALESKVAGTSDSHQRVRPDDLLSTPIGDPRRWQHHRVRSRPWQTDRVRGAWLPEWLPALNDGHGNRDVNSP
jgi:hypothetical protein